MLTLTVLPDGRLEVRNHGLILHTLTAPEAFVLAGNILAPHHYGAIAAVMDGNRSGVQFTPPAVPANVAHNVVRNAPDPDAPASPMSPVRDN